MKSLRDLSLLLLTLASLSVSAAPVSVDASDLIGKVYAVADPSGSKEECRLAVGKSFNAVPAAEEGAEWVSSEDGFSVCYEGMTPEAEAMARYDKAGYVAGYGYIFYFPYESACREEANCQQCRFCTALLQELTEMGISLGADPMTDSLFDVEGAFMGGDLQLTLSEVVDRVDAPEDLPAGAVSPDQSGSFILLVSVVPSVSASYTAQGF